MGFGAKIESKTNLSVGDILKYIRPEDLIKYGLIPEFVGRLPVVVTLEELDKPSLVKILTEPKNALVKQYKELFAMDDVELEFEKDALDLISQKAIERKTGARGLRSIIEETMLDIMYEIPSRDDIEKCVITKETIMNGGEPTLVISDRKKKARQKKSGERETAS